MNWLLQEPTPSSEEPTSSERFASANPKTFDQHFDWLVKRSKEWRTLTPEKISHYGDEVVTGIDCPNCEHDTARIRIVWSHTRPWKVSFCALCEYFGAHYYGLKESEGILPGGWEMAVEIVTYVSPEQRTFKRKIFNWFKSIFRR